MKGYGRPKFWRHVIFAVLSQSAKSAKVMRLENTALYGILHAYKKYAITKYGILRSTKTTRRNLTPNEPDCQALHFGTKHGVIRCCNCRFSGCERTPLTTHPDGSVKRERGGKTEMVHHTYLLSCNCVSVIHQTRVFTDAQTGTIL